MSKVIAAARKLARNAISLVRKLAVNPSIQHFVAVGLAAGLARGAELLGLSLGSSVANATAVALVAGLAAKLHLKRAA